MPSSRPCLVCERPTFGTIHNECRRQQKWAAVAAEDDDIVLAGGRWVPADGIMRWSPDPAPEQPSFLFPENERRDAHRRYYLGDREPSTVAAEREYQRDMKQCARRAKQNAEVAVA